MAATSMSLWRQPDFLKLWAGQATSQIGSQVTFLALPLVAIVTLDASPQQMGILTAVGAVPPLLLGLHAGAAVDRRRRQPLLIGSDLGRALLLGLIPLAWTFGALSIELLYVVAFLSGALGLVFDLAYQAFLPTLVRHDQLVEGNSKLELSHTAAEIAGPSLAGGLVQLLSAPVALAADALSYLLSALLLARIRVTEMIPSRTGERRTLLADIRTGLRHALGDVRLRALIGSRGIIAFFNAMLETIFVLYIVDVLGISAAMIGLSFSIGSVGFIAGAFLPARLADRLGVGASMAIAVAVVALSDLLLPLAAGSPLVIMGFIATGQFFFGLGLTVFNVNQVSLRQALVPPALRGRVSAVVRILPDALVPIGAVAGGLLGTAVGLRETLFLAALGELSAAVWLWFSPIRAVIALPTENGPGAAE